jgi:uncharacterized protein
MNRFGLTKHELGLILGVLRQHPEVDAARIFDSRALGTQRPNSDIDVALYGEIDTSQMLAIHHEWDELPLPDKFDLAIYSTLSYDDLKRHIGDQGRTLYSKASQTFTTPKRQ